MGLGAELFVTVAFGFPAPPVPEGQDGFNWFEENRPDGWHFEAAGNFFIQDDTDIAVYALYRHSAEIFNGTPEDFGAFAVNDLFEVTAEDWVETINTAERMGVSANKVGYYILTSIGPVG